MIFKELKMGGFWYFDVLRMSGVWNFAFQIWSIYCTMQRAEYSYTLRHIQSLNWDQKGYRWNRLYEPIIELMNNGIVNLHEAYFFLDNGLL